LQKTPGELVDVEYSSKYIFVREDATDVGDGEVMGVKLAEMKGRGEVCDSGTALNKAEKTRDCLDGQRSDDLEAEDEDAEDVDEEEIEESDDRVEDPSRQESGPTGVFMTRLSWVTRLILVVYCWATVLGLE
jgi:hypothetical protein